MQNRKFLRLPLDLSRYLVGEIAEVTGMLKTFITERPLPVMRARTRPELLDLESVTTLIP